MWMDQIKQKKVESHLNWPSALLFDLAHKQCNGIINVWLFEANKMWLIIYYYNVKSHKKIQN